MKTSLSVMSLEHVENGDHDHPEEKKTFTRSADLEQQTPPQFAFNSASIRAAFVRKVFAIVTVMILVVIVMVTPVITVDDIRLFMIKNSWVYWIGLYMFVAFAATVAVFIFGIVLAIMSLFIYIKMIVGGKRYEISPEDYIFAALMLFIDIYEIFVSMLSLFNAANN
ncbi:hypothetical protein ANCDUO_11245 [Ancylostoma duodenale]|uniref:Uncharacterized protein n=1 Tax=Ancylostoma duodenale TaxID=51022 RepID=A0A0C2GI52_9BILA|nr:hypothetical protein ANCDUO_11245 [Ancylostoma duodenale]